MEDDFTHNVEFGSENSTIWVIKQLLCKNMNKYIENLLSVPKSFYFCLRCMPLKQALRLPIFVRYNVLVRNVGKIETGGQFHSVRIGFGNVGIFDRKNERTVWDNTGKVRFGGRAFIGQGSRIVVGNNGQWNVGDNFACTSKMSLICYKSITMGKDVLISWETLLMDTDMHYIAKAGDMSCAVNEKEITIGNHVWIGCRTTILKGTVLCDNCIIAAGSVVVKPFTETSALIGGNPAVVKRQNVEWTEVR